MALLGNFSTTEDMGLSGGGPLAESSQAQMHMPGCCPRVLSWYGFLRVAYGSLRPSTSLGAAASFWECHLDLRTLELGVFIPTSVLCDLRQAGLFTKEV